jgi:ribosomal protein L21E
MLSSIRSYLMAKKRRAWAPEQVRTLKTLAKRFEGKTGHVVVDAEDALIAALKVKMQRPEVLIASGDTRHPMRRLSSESR